MKKIISIVSAMTLMAGFSASAFASMKFIGDENKPLPPTSQSVIFEANIVGVDFLYDKGQPLVFVSLDANGVNAHIQFDGVDTAYGMQFAGALGKQMTVYFVKKSNFDIEQLHVEKDWPASEVKPQLNKVTVAS